MFSMSPSVATLAPAFVKAQSQVKGALKESTNPFFKSKYADLSSNWEACREALHANGFTIIQGGDTELIEGKLKINTMLLHSSGEWITSTFLLTPKANDAQAEGSAITYGRRYGLAAMVGICPEDDDGEGAMGRKPEAIKPQPPYRAPSVTRKTLPTALNTPEQRKALELADIISSLKGKGVAAKEMTVSKMAADPRWTAADIQAVRDSLQTQN